MSSALVSLSRIDSTTMSLPLTRYLWAFYKKTKSGVKLHPRLNYIDGNDKVFNVFGRAYLDYKKFDEYCNKGILFATRLKKNAIKEILGQNPLNTNQYIKSDSIIVLGKDGINKMHNPLRCIKAVDLESKEIEIITNNFEASAEEIGDVYRHHWQIENLFKWVKQHLKAKHPHGLSKQAVETQLYIVLITYCLLEIVKLKNSYTGSLLEIQRLLKACFHEPFSCFLTKLLRKPRHSSRGRPKDKHEIVFKMLERQVLKNEIDHLDDLTYDPIIL